MPGVVVGICGDGETLAAIWTTPDGDRDVLGLWVMDGLVVTPPGDPVTTNDFQILSTSRKVSDCAVGPSGVQSIHVGYEGALGNPIPLSRMALWEDSATSIEKIITNVTHRFGLLVRQRHRLDG